ncbi:MAG TPA: hypothetical protein VFZ63_16755 [Jiangellaceae bacterium]
MNPVSEGFLLAVAGIAATLIGLLLVGAFFYIETGLRRATTVAPQGGPFLRATTKLTLLLYSLALGISLGLVVLPPVALLVLYVVLSLALVRALVEWSVRYRNLRGVLPIPRESPWIMWSAVIALLALPLVLGGWEPGRESMTWTLLGAGALAVVSTAGMVLTSFDLASLEETTRANPPASDDDGLAARRDEVPLTTEPQT